MRSLVRKLLKLPLLPFALACAVAVRLLRLAGVEVRFGGLVSTRIGHLCGNTELYLCERAQGRRGGFHIWTHYGPVCNEQMGKMVVRALRKAPRTYVDTTGFLILVVLMNKLFPGWEHYDVGFTTWDRDVNGLLQKHPQFLHLTEAEEARGRHNVASLGIPLGAKWVCLFVRDAGYLPSMTYHNYRNADVDTYAEAALALARRGYYVVRMCKDVLKPFAAKHPRIIDYAMSPKLDDFTSVYLAAHCYFAVSSGLGLDSICEVFRRPVAFTNYVPVGYIRTYHPHSLTIWKHHEKEGKRMNVAEIHKEGADLFLSSKEFEDAKITLVDNTPQEIRDVAEEMADIMEGRSRPDPQSDFWTRWPGTYCPFHKYPLHGVMMHRIGRKFLESYAGR